LKKKKKKIFGGKGGGAQKEKKRGFFKKKKKLFPGKFLGKKKKRGFFPKICGGKKEKKPQKKIPPGAFKILQFPPRKNGGAQNLKKKIKRVQGPKKMGKGFF